MNDHGLLIPIKQKWVSMILSGCKTVEMRRVMPRRAREGSLAFIYATSPIQAIVGAFRIERLLYGNLDEIWRQVGEESCLTEPEYYRYYCGKDKAVAIAIGPTWTFSNPLALEDMQNRYNLYAPQSIIYLDSDTRRTLFNVDKQLGGCMSSINMSEPIIE
ncbi:ASCH domain-containing protein [bacterium]|nr:ASCH domain-containing protein [bacterium]